MVRELRSGVGFFVRGMGVWATSFRLMFLGAIPALVVGLIVLTAVIIVAVNVGSIAEWATPFADSFDPFWRDATRAAASVGLVLAVILLALATFTALTLAVGDPFYERIWCAVEAREGGFSGVEEPGFWTSLGRAVVSGLRLLLPTAAVGVLLFAVGFIPVVGGFAAILLGAVLGGRLLARELLSRPFDARGLDHSAQARIRRAHRAQLTGFGAVAYLLFLLPLGAVVAMPAAVAGSTLLARRLLDETRPDHAEPGLRAPTEGDHPFI